MLRRILKIVLLLVPLAYVLVGVFLYVEQRRFLYFPEGTHVPVADTNYTLQRVGVALRGWVVNPGQSRAVLFFGGNGDSVQQMRGLVSRWAPGRTIYLPAYRGYGASEGRPSEAALFADALALYDDIRSRHAEVTVIGRSLGSGVASYLASRRPVSRLVLVTPFDSVARVAQVDYPMYPVGWMLEDRFESWRYVADITAPALVIEAANDEIIPTANTEQLVAAFKRPPQLVRVAQAGHGTVLERPATSDAIRGFLEGAASTADRGAGLH
jgi:pimeloyl-ACP methyl ester carboxylesterase